MNGHRPGRNMIVARRFPLIDVLLHGDACDYARCLRFVHPYRDGLAAAQRREDKEPNLDGHWITSDRVPIMAQMLLAPVDSRLWHGPRLGMRHKAPQEM